MRNFIGNLSLQSVINYMNSINMSDNEKKLIISIFNDCDKYNNFGKKDNNHNQKLNLYELAKFQKRLSTECKDLWLKIKDAIIYSDKKNQRAEEPDATFVAKVTPMYRATSVNSVNSVDHTNVKIPKPTEIGEKKAQLCMGNRNDKRVSANLKKFEPYFQAASQKTGVPVSILKAIAAKESTMGIAPGHSVTGIQQQHMKKYITDQEIKKEGYKRDALDPKSAILATARMIAEDYKKTGNLAKTLVGYNVGFFHDTYKNFKKIYPGGYADTVIALSKHFV